MGEGGCVGSSQPGDQAALVALVVQQRGLFGIRGGIELAALIAVGHGDLQANLRSTGGGTVKGDASLNECAKHGEEAAAWRRNGGAIAAIGSDVAVAVEQVGAWHADIGEVQAAVVDPVQPALEAVVLSADAWQEVSLVITDWNVETMNAVIDALGDQLGKDRGCLAVQCGVAQIVLPRRLKWGVDDEFFGLFVVGRGSRHRGNI